MFFIRELYSLITVFIDKTVDTLIKDACLEITKRYELHFCEIGTDKDHVHFLTQTIPTYTVTKQITIIKSITDREVFTSKPELKKELWGSSLWTSGYYASTVGKRGNESTITQYVKHQGRSKEYTQLHKDQLILL